MVTNLYVRSNDEASLSKVEEKFDLLKKLLKSYHEVENEAGKMWDDEEYVTDPDLLILMGFFYEKRDRFRSLKGTFVLLTVLCVLFC